jgi:hypothetical protein
MIGPGDQQAQAQQVINAIAQAAAHLYDLLQPGMVVDVTIPDKSDIVIPNQPKRLRRLLIVKPYIHIDLHSKPNGE